MKKNEKVNIKGMDIKSLQSKVINLKKEIADLTFEKNTKKLKDLKSVDKKRKEVAFILTVLQQKQLLEKLEPQQKEVQKS